MNNLKKIIYRLFSTSMAGLYMILFALAIAIATFVENDFGTSSAQKVIFKARWFELLLLLFGITILVNIFRFRMVQQKKWALLSFHASMVIILIGAGVTRYLGYEGMMHIREGDASNTFLSTDTYLVFETELSGKKYVFDEPVYFATLGNNYIKKSYLLGNEEVTVEVLDFVPNPAEVMTDADDGLPTLQVVIGGANGREEYYIKQGDRVRLRGTLFNFRETEDPAAFNIKVEDGLPYFKTNQTYTQMQMAIQKKDTMVGGLLYPLKLRSLYSNGLQSFVFGKYSEAAKVEMTSTDQKMASTSMAGLKIKVSNGTESQEQMVYGAMGVEGRPRTFQVGNTPLSVAYGAKRIELPFSLKLREFILEKYPGTNSASSYASEVTLLDNRTNLIRNQRIYMNHILNYDGYRFFQSSFDQDELGTYLSVNHDFWGTWISYLGYAILTIGMFMVFFDKKSRFQQLTRQLKRMENSREKQKPSRDGRFPRPSRLFPSKKEKSVEPEIVSAASEPKQRRSWENLSRTLFGATVSGVKKYFSSFFLVLLIAIANPINANPVEDGLVKSIDFRHAEKFGQLVMQDHRGRMKPMDTYTSEILRKLSRKESLYGLTAEQIILGMAANPKEWYHVPLIKGGKHEKTKKLLGDKDGLLTYSDFFLETGGYKLREAVRAAYNTPKKDRGVFEKEMMKLDEKVNITSMVFSGSFMKVFPVPNDENNTWESPVESNHQGHNHDHSHEAFSRKFYSAYIPTLQKAIQDNDWNLANQLIDELTLYQHKFGAAVMPSAAKVSAELWLNELNVFSRLGKIYGLLGLLFLGLLFTSVFKPGVNLYWPNRVAMGMMVLAFLFHLLGLGLRWYVSGRAPWSNGYESMIYIAFTTVLAGLIFGRKSMGGMAATSILASTILMVAGLSWLDPEITPLVPVLKSYWLTIHVSLIAGSYGFLMLGALIGVLNLIFMIFKNQNNLKNVNRIIKEMSTISEMTLLGGLFMISIGTYLGGVWANESWGRYWGWDAKETWALVTILVYAFILHMRFIPGFRGPYAYNVATLFGWASVIMTYFGVNYYLSGLHSYAAGDPVPIPTFVYYAVGILTVLGVAAWWRDRQFRGS